MILAGKQLRCLDSSPKPWKVGKVENINGFHTKTNEQVGKVGNNNDFDRKPIEKVGKVRNSNDLGRQAIEMSW